MVFTTDAYGTVILEYQGADLETRSFNIYPESFASVGAWAQDPAGWSQLYRRPNPHSTAGVYVLVQNTAGYQGSLFPYVPSVIVKLHLGENSTQNSAYIAGGAGTIAITDKKAFIRSLRRVLDAKASLKIDPALLVTGPAKFTEVT